MGMVNDGLYSIIRGDNMDCYQEMYLKLFNKITDVINELQNVQIEAEEIFISYKTPDNILHIPPKGKDEE